MLVTLDTTRADAIGPGAPGIETPAFDALARRGRLFRQAYATVPETLPSHASMLTGLYAAGHAVHENARPLPREHALLAERLQQAGYRTAAFVSSVVLARRFGLARGFFVYDDELPAGQVERSAAETTTRAAAFLSQASPEPLFVWVHYYDPHHPYSPPEPFRGRYAKNPYLGEIAAMDAELGRLVQAFERRARGPAALVVVGDHGEGLGDHGESQHGKLLYQATMRVPLVVVGPGVTPGVSDAPVSTRRVFHTILDWAGLADARSLRVPKDEVVLGEGMKPFLAYGWQPQVMAAEGRFKVIQAGAREVYDLAADPREARDLAGTAELSRALRTALVEYPIPSLAPPPPSAALGAEERLKLASLGYVSAGATPVVRKDAPRPAAMAALFETLDTASTLFVREEYARVIPLLVKILARDPVQSGRRAPARHRALGPGAEGGGGQGLRLGSKGRPRLAGRPRLPRAPPGARQRVGGGPSPARAGARPVARSPAGARGARQPPRAAGTSRGRALAVAGSRAARPTGGARGQGELAMQVGQNGARHRLLREGALGPGRGVRPRPRAGVLYLADRRLPRHATRSSACRRRTPATRWRSSSARR